MSTLVPVLEKIIITYYLLDNHCQQKDYKVFFLYAVNRMSKTTNALILLKTKYVSGLTGIE